ncbi:serine/threonine-protein kinase [Micromonospora carbonacea]|uniref:non-specific serine/threonine protein kinase n=1 Tax=Micromonospora carbonacea TaxID=47853 RepID=A0A7H8XQI7_9ACTN|nr:serine/threonine-protein kinase [Micromonospora carbonacea]MBB5825519.1 tRNA A-37 threonylcarbamoyl transferase component Bud32 [Micromonospora carbonacea]QLD26439.1 protein kinase [Micromonospora carbonacea]
MQQVVIGGRYRLLDLVGRGGMGKVWRARDEMLHRDVAVKQVVPPAVLSGDELDELRLRTLREARTTARLNHPNVVRVYDVVPVDGDPWLIMEYVPSRSLQHILDTSGPLPPRRAAAVGLALLAALRAAHQAGVLHRDVKPANVLVAHDGRVMLTDFGLAVFDGGDGVMTRPGLVLGSPQFVAPERAAEGISSVEADLWSLGATLHAAVEGKSPYARSTAMATLSALATQPPDPAPHAGPLRPVLVGLLRRDPRRRIDHEETRRRLAQAAAPGADPSPVTIAPQATVVPPDAAPPDGPAGPADADRLVVPGWSTGPPGRDAPAGRKPAGTGPARDGPGPAAPTGPAAPASADVPFVIAPAGPADAVAPAGRRWPLAVSGVVIVLLVAHTVVFALFRPHTGREASPPATPGAGPGPSAAGPMLPPLVTGVPPPPFPCLRPYPFGVPPPTVAPAPDDPLRPPSGWSWYADPAGFRLAVPPGWRQYRDGSAVCFQDPSARRILTVAPADDRAAAPLDQLRANERRAQEAGALPRYERIRLAEAAGRGAEWECAWDAPLGARLRGAQLIPFGARSWSLAWSGPEEEWDAGAAERETMRSSFRVAGTA